VSSAMTIGLCILRRMISAALIAFVVVPVPIAFGWGPEGHIWINRVAVEKTPREMPLFFRQAVAEQSHTQVEVYQLAKAGGLTDHGSPEACAFTVSRLAAGSQMLLNLWYTAWLDSSQPPTPPKYE
jgi:hypothetical protein